MTNDERNRFGAQILDASIAVHRELGPGLLECAYEFALMQELVTKGLKVRRQVPVQLFYKGLNLGKAYEIDLPVEEEIIVEIKAVLDMHPIYTAQIITYLKLFNKKLGYLVNFNEALLKNGFKRIVYNFYSLRNPLLLPFPAAASQNVVFLCRAWYL
jgi:GxxExxY protein